MREGVEMTKGERRARSRDLKLFITETQKKVNYELGLYKAAAKAVSAAARNFQNAEVAYSKKSSVKNSYNYEEAKTQLLDNAGSYKRMGAQVAATVDAINDAYAQLTEVSLDPAKVRMEADKYNLWVSENVKEIQSMIEGVEIEDAPKTEEEEEMANERKNTYEGTNEAPANEVPAYAAAQQPAYAPAYGQPYAPAYAPAYGQPYAPAYAQPYAPAPAYAPPAYTQTKIDVTPIVEKAIAAAMDKFSQALDKKIESYMENYDLKLPVANGVNNEEVAAVEGAILDEEQFLLDKLTAMVDNIKALMTQVAELTAAYNEIASKSADANELQKQTNDMQRRTLREQQGIQVSQRVISQDQIAVAQSQTALAEQQKLAMERQQALTDAQAAMEETQRVLAENQATLEESMKTVMQAQKDIISAQQALMAGNAKNAETQAEMAARQAETLALQKEALTSQKQVLKDQKATLDKQKDVAATKKKAPKAE